MAAVGEDIERYEFYQGTSMAAPHGTGSAALIVGLHPDWTRLRSVAIALTAWQDIINSDGVSPTDPFDIGSGRIDLTQAAFAGFVIDERPRSSYIAANPCTGGAPNTLNQPGVVEYTCFGTCTWTRTLKSTLAVDQEWQVQLLDSADTTLSALAPDLRPALPAASRSSISATLSPGGSPQRSTTSADVVLTPTGGDPAVAQPAGRRSDRHLQPARRAGHHHRPVQPAAVPVARSPRRSMTSPTCG